MCDRAILPVIDREDLCGLRLLLVTGSPQPDFATAPALALRKSWVTARFCSAMAAAKVCRSRKLSAWARMSFVTSWPMFGKTVSDEVTGCRPRRRPCWRRLPKRTHNACVVRAREYHWPMGWEIEGTDEFADGSTAWTERRCGRFRWPLMH